MHIYSWSPRCCPTLHIMLVPLVTLLLSGCIRPTAHETLPTWTVPALPDTPAGHQVDAYLTVFNGGDQTALKHFIADHFTPIGPGGADLTTRTNAQLRLYSTSHGLNLYHVTDSHPTAVTLLAQLRLTQEWRHITFTVEDAPPHRVSGIRIEPTDAPAMANAELQSDDQLPRQIEAYMHDLVAADRFSGVVLVAKDGIRLFEGAYGMANKARRVPNHITTRFGFASVGKMFTAVAIAQLVEAGKLAYDAPINTYLPDYPADVARRITIDHLLTHRSGLVDYFADPQRFATVKNSSDPQRDYPAIFMHAPLRFTPGARFEYSNSNYILLGAIIERVSGERYADYIRRHIFEPAGMDETTLTSDDITQSLLAHPYTESDAGGVIRPSTRHAADDAAPAVGSAAGGGYATAGDLLKFAHALRAAKLVSATGTMRLLADRVDDERPGYRYAYGFIVRRAGTERIVGHSGGFPGVDAQFEMYMDRGYTVIALANYEGVAEPIMSHVQQLLAHP